jgi:hypothetical protein
VQNLATILPNRQPCICQFFRIFFAKKLLKFTKKLAGTENEIEIRSTALLGEGRKQERVATMGREAYPRDDYPALVMNQEPSELLPETDVGQGEQGPVAGHLPAALALQAGGRKVARQEGLPPVRV